MAALAFARCALPSYDRALWALCTWLDSWSGSGHVAVGMHRRGFDLQLTRYDERGWRATFYTTGVEHSPTSATGTGRERSGVPGLRCFALKAPARQADFTPPPRRESCSVPGAQDNKLSGNARLRGT